MKHSNKVKEGEIKVLLDSRIYSKDSIFKCLYWYSNDFRTKITCEDEFTFCIILNPINNKVFDKNKLDEILLKLERDLLDYNLRDIVTKETLNIRDLLIAKAFSNGEYDELPPGEISDPVGFNPSS